jgi:hypothetical protein
MDEKTEALQAIRTLIDVASESDDIDMIYKHLRMMRNIVNKTLPPRKRAKLKVVK